MFILDFQLASDTVLIGDLPLCNVLLMNNSLYPWIILVPKRADITEIMELTEKDRHILIEEITQISKLMKNTYWPDKINVAALGNVVPQLHIHIIARFKTDDSWPDPVWGKGIKPYSDTGLPEALDILRRECKKIDGFVPVANNLY